MNSFSQAWWNGSYMIAAKPIETLELHYNMIQFFFKRGLLLTQVTKREKKFILK